MSDTDEARQLKTYRDTFEVLRKLHIQTGDAGETIIVDANEVIRDDRDVRWWLLEHADDDRRFWHHGPAHGDEYFPLGDVLLGLAACYTDRLNQ